MSSGAASTRLYVTALQIFGLSSICNIVAAIKTAKYFDLGPDDVILTVATDGAEMYGSEVRKALRALLRQPLRRGRRRRDLGPRARRRGHRSSHRAQPHRPQAGVQPRLFHLGRAAGRVARGIPGAREQSFWDGLLDLAPAWDAMIEKFNARERRRRQARRDGSIRDAAFVCHGCGAVVDPVPRVAFRLPQRRSGRATTSTTCSSPPAKARGLDVGDGVRTRSCATDDGCPLTGLRGRKNCRTRPGPSWSASSTRRWRRVDGRGFRMTPMARQPALAAALGLAGDLWIKDETGNVWGSHKARHLMGVMLYLAVLEHAGLPRRAGACGSGGWRSPPAAMPRSPPQLSPAPPTGRSRCLSPPTPSRRSCSRLRDLGAGSRGLRAPRRRNRRPLRSRSREGGRRRGHSVRRAGARQWPRGGRRADPRLRNGRGFRPPRRGLDALFVQVGGGALASALAQGFAMPRPRARRAARRG